MSHAEYGPLSLQMGSVTTGVADLVHGYEQLVNKLPDLTETVLSVHANTEQMTKELEHRTRSLVDGYEYLQGLSTLLPEAFMETASAHRRTLQDAINLLTPEEHAKIEESTKTLATIRGNLQSITLERKIMESSMRPRMLESRRILAHRRADNQQSLQRRHAHYTTENTAARVAATMTRTSTYTQPSSHHAAARVFSSTAGSGKAAQGPATETVGFDRAAEALNKPIHIPQYNPDAPRQAPIAAGTTAPSQRAGGAAVRPYAGVTGYLNPAAAAVGSTRLTARSVAGSVMVPAMSHGLPAEVQNLKTAPSPAITAADYLDREMRRVARKRTMRRSKVVVVEKEPLAHSLREKLSQTEEEVNVLKMRLAAGHDAFGKDQSKAIQKLQALVKQLQEQRDGRDEALLAEVQKLLKEALKNKTPPNRDAEILKALEALLVPPKRVAVIDRLHEYKVLTARPKTPVPVRTVPVIAPVSRPPEPEPPKCVEVQTEPLPEPARAPTPPPIPVPAAPQPIIVNVPAPPAPAPAPAASGLERELIDLMRSVVDTQHQTMQGNQALILSLIHERNQPPPEPEYIVEEFPEPSTPRMSTPPPVMVEPPPPPVVVKPRPAYSTAFGAVLLGAELMEGPYETPPTVVPPALQPCVLRGVPLPRPKREPLVADPSGALEASGDPDNAPAHRGRTSAETEGGVVAHGAVSDGSHAPSAAVGGGGDRQPTSTDVEVGQPMGEKADLMAVAGNGSDASTATATVTAFAAPEVEPTPATAASAPVPGAEQVPQLLPPGDDKANIGLSGAGSSSTAGRGGSQQHTTPGAVHRVHPSDIPPHMRRVASEFTMRALRHPYKGDTAGQAAVVGTEVPSAASAAAATEAAAAATEAQPLLTLLQNLHTLSSTSVAAMAGGMAITAPTTVNSDSIAQLVSEGVHRGVKEALGLMDTHSPNQQTYYKPPSGQQHTDRHRPFSPLRSSAIMLSVTDRPDDAVRDSLQLLKSRRGCGRNTRAVLDKGDEHRYHSRTRGLTSRNMPHSRRQENTIRDSGIEYDQETYGQPRATKADVDQVNMDRELRQEVENSRRRRQRLLDADENSSFNDSVSLDEETAAFLRDPLTHNMGSPVESEGVASSSDLSVEGTGRGRQVQLLHHDMHDKVRSDLFSAQERVPVQAGLAESPRGGRAAVANVQSSRPAAPAGRIVPLVSRVLAQSATEEVFLHGGIGAFGERGGMDSANLDDDSVVASPKAAEAGAELWDMDVSTLGAERLVSTVAAAPRVPAGPGAGLKLLKGAGGALDRRSRAGVVAGARSPASSMSIVTRSAASSSSDSASEHAGRTEDIPEMGGSAPLSVPAGRGDHTGPRENPHFNPRSSQSSASSEDSQLSYKRSGRPSLLPRFSYASTTEQRAQSKDNTTSSIRGSGREGGGSRSRSTSRRGYRQDTRTAAGSGEEEGDPVGTERLAAQMMLNVLELHRPGAYSTRPHLANPIGPRYHRSKIYTTDSDDSRTGAKEGDDGSAGLDSSSDLGNITGSSVSSGGELLDRTPAAAVGRARGGPRLLGVNVGTKLLSIRK